MHIKTSEFLYSRIVFQLELSLLVAVDSYSSAVNLSLSVGPDQSLLKFSAAPGSVSPQMTIAHPLRSDVIINGTNLYLNLDVGTMTFYLPGKRLCCSCLVI